MEIIQFFDVDDVPHPQRIEITKNVFGDSNCDALVHSYQTDNKKFSIFNNLNCIGPHSMKGVFFYLKVHNLNTRLVHNDRIDFHKACELLEVTFKNSELINIMKIRKLGQKIALHIRWGLEKIPSTSKHDLMHLENNLKALINPRVKNYMNLHSRLCISLKLNQKNNYIMLYKSIFTRRPMQILWILYSN